MTQPLPKKAPPVLAPLPLSPSGSKRPPVPTKIGAAPKAPSASRASAPPPGRAVKRDEPTLLSPPPVAAPARALRSVPSMRAPEPTMVESTRFDEDASPATEREPIPPSQCATEASLEMPPTYRAEQGTLLSIPVDVDPPVRASRRPTPPPIVEAPVAPKKPAPSVAPRKSVHSPKPQASLPPALPRVATLASVPPPVPVAARATKPSAPPPLPRASAAALPMMASASPPPLPRVSISDASPIAPPVATLRGFAPPPSLSAFAMGRAPEAPLPQPLDVVLPPPAYDSDADPVILPMRGPFRSIRRFFRLIAALPRLIREARAERRLAAARPAARRVTFHELAPASLGFASAPPSSQLG